MNSLRPIAMALVAALALSALPGGCAHTTREPTQHGHLVIVGGGLKDDNAAIHNRFVELCAPGPIGIIPTASGGGLETGEGSAASWRRWAGSREVIVIPLTKDDVAKADDPAVAAQIASCGGLWFTGGDQSRITAVMRPDGRRSATLDACFKVLERGGVIGGNSAGAAMMSDPMITGGQSRGRSTRDPDETASLVRTGPGLGFVSGVLTDQHFLERGRMGRLLDALIQTGVTTGIGIRENGAAVVHRENRRCEVIGSRAVCVLRIGDKPILGGEAHARLSVLSTGDVFVLESGRTHPDPGLSIMRHPTPPIGFAPDWQKVPDPWERRTMESAFDALNTVPSAIERENDRVFMSLQALGTGSVYAHPGKARPACLVDVALTVRPAPPTGNEKPRR